MLKKTARAGARVGRGRACGHRSGVRASQAKAADEGGPVPGRPVVIATPGRMLMLKACPPPGSMPKAQFMRMSGRVFRCAKPTSPAG